MRSRCASSSLPAWSSSPRRTASSASMPLMARSIRSGPGHVVRGREDVELGVLADHLASQRVQRHQPLDLVAEHLDPDGEFLVHRDDLDGVTADPERAAGEGQVVPVVLHADQLAEQLVPLDGVAQLDLEHPVHVLLRRAQAVDARHGGHDDGVPPGEQRVGGGVPEPLDLGVDGGVLLDVGVGLRDVRLGLVVVVVGDEVLDRVVGQHLAQLVGELGGERLIRQHDEHRPLQPLRDPGHRGGLAGAGRAEQTVCASPARTRLSMSAMAVG